MKLSTHLLFLSVIATTTVTSSPIPTDDNSLSRRYIPLTIWQGAPTETAKRDLEEGNTVEKRYVPPVIWGGAPAEAVQSRDLDNDDTTLDKRYIVTFFAWQGAPEEAVKRSLLEESLSPKRSISTEATEEHDAEDEHV